MLLLGHDRRCRLCPVRPASIGLMPPPPSLWDFTLLLLLLEADPLLLGELVAVQLEKILDLLLLLGVHRRWEFIWLDAGVLWLFPPPWFCCC